MLALYLIIFGCFLGNLTQAMEEQSLRFRSGQDSYFYDSEDDSVEPAPADSAPQSSLDDIKAHLAAEHAYEAQLLEQLYNEEISQAEYDAYFENKALKLMLQIIPTEPDINAANNCGQTRLHLALIVGENKDPETLTTCKKLIGQGASIAQKNSQDQTALYLASVHKKSAPLTKTVLTTCPSIKPALMQIWLVGKRTKRPLPKDVLLKCLAPYIIFNETERQMNIIRSLLTEVLEEKTVYHPNPMAGRNVPVKVRKGLDDLVKSDELKQLLNPANIEQHRATITAELYATIGIALTPQASTDEVSK